MSEPSTVRIQKTVDGSDEVVTASCSPSALKVWEKLGWKKVTDEPSAEDKAAAELADAGVTADELPGAVDASVALAHDLPLFTRNPDDFAHLRAVGLGVVAV